MPSRIVREAILTSASVCSLAWPEEVFYRRLMSIVDDYGRHEANQQLLRSRCYPLQTDQVRVADISRLMAACQKAGLVVLYEVAGKQYLQIEKFGQQQRSKSKYPQPPTSTCEQLLSDAEQQIASAPVFVDVSVSEDGCEGEPARKRATPPPCPADVDHQVWSDWLQLRKAKKAPVTDTVIGNAVDEAAKAGMTLEAFLRVWCARGSQGLQADWLKPSERGSPGGVDAEPEWRRAQRERNEAFLGPAAARRPTKPQPETIDMEAINGAARIVG